MKILKFIILGNPRNKVTLQPGHSLMDWIRLGTSGRDLTGLGPNAGNLMVTKKELSRHNKRSDAWIAIRGKVYNLTEYFPFHPGGEEELMKGVGKDATNIFDDVHPWVNYEQILQKCYIGKLGAMDPDIDKELLFFGEKKAPSSQYNQVDRFSTNPTTTPIESDLTVSNLPRFDWIQQIDFITVIFYTKAFSNPGLEISDPTEKRTVEILLTYNDQIFKNELIFHKNIQTVCDVNVVIETGKVELVFRKASSGIWDNYGVLHQTYINSSSNSSEQFKTSYILKSKLQLNYNTWQLNFQRQDKKQVVVPIGKHFRIFSNIDGEEVTRSYTAIPEYFLSYQKPRVASDYICFVIKRYPEGKLSKYIIDKDLNTQVEFSKPLGKFDLKLVEKRETFLLLAAGTGITPMLALILFLLERRIRKCQFIRLLNFNRTENDILLKDQFEKSMECDKRFKINDILSQPSDSWPGHRGFVNSILIENCLNEHLKDTGYTIKDIYCYICGPRQFNELARNELEKLKITHEQIHLFEG
ncbi:hypothetical protein ABEB36_008401 [Hypothenemus hampei]|uniref:Cytochrome b5 reductase 4 n=1 Tax=Hypothenemus hampei TaxID=57062 RepID=A0ABD1ELQ1_HYPHA